MFRYLWALSDHIDQEFFILQRGISPILPRDSKQQGHYLNSNHKLKINCVDYDKQNKEFVFESCQIFTDLVMGSKLFKYTTKDNLEDYS